MKKFEKNDDPIEFVIKRDGAKSLRFKGWLIAGRIFRFQPYDGKLEYSLYQTTGGNFVVQEWDWNRAGCNSFRAKLCKSESEITDFFGQEECAQAFYAFCEIDNSVCVE